jgi:DNA-binding transcriptional regulator GbsR (MarR family)
MNLTSMVEDFVLHFGEMGSRWGINRTVGQIYALLFVSDRPLNADEIVDRLGFSRSNVSMGLKELQAWNLVRLRHLPDDRRDYFSTPDNIWEVVRTLVEERKKREIDPTLSVLRELAMRSPGNPEEGHAQSRIRQMTEVIEIAVRWYDDVKGLETERLAQLLALGARVQQVLEMRDKIGSLSRIARPKAAKSERTSRKS